MYLDSIYCSVYLSVVALTRHTQLCGLYSFEYCFHRSVVTSSAVRFTGFPPKEAHQMHMDGWEDYLHFSFLGEHILVKTLPLNSFANFIWGTLLTVVLCLIERYLVIIYRRRSLIVCPYNRSLTFAITKHWSPFPSTRRSRFRDATWRAAMYWIVTLLRL